MSNNRMDVLKDWNEREKNMDAGFHTGLNSLTSKKSLWNNRECVDVDIPFLLRNVMNTTVIIIFYWMHRVNQSTSHTTHWEHKNKHRLKTRKHAHTEKIVDSIKLKFQDFVHLKWVKYSMVAKLELHALNQLDRR